MNDEYSVQAGVETRVKSGQVSLLAQRLIKLSLRALSRDGVQTSR